VSITYFLADHTSAAIFGRIAPHVFDHAVSSSSVVALLRDERHHIVIASDDHMIVGFVSAVDYFLPDKARELWINEVGVAPGWRGNGIAKRLMALMLEHGRKIGCTEAWVLSEHDNGPANALYRSLASEADPRPTAATMHNYKLV